MSEQNFCLDWSEFEAFTKRTVQNLLDDKEFTDVTLVCDDNRQIGAHKAILSACSPSFKNILKNNPHQHPLIYLRGVKYQDLQSLVSFIYQGRTEVSQENLNRFLFLASEFQLEGIGDTKSSFEEETTKEETEMELGLPENYKTTSESRKMQELELCETDVVDVNAEFIESLEGRSTGENKFPCDKCEYKSNRRDNLRTHINSVHNEVRYPCDDCEYKATQRSHLNRHKRVRHSVR